LRRERRQGQRRDAPPGPVARLVNRRLRILDVERRPVLRLDEVGTVTGDTEGRINWLLGERLHERMELALDSGRVEDDVHCARLRLPPDEGVPLQRADP